MMKKLGKDLKRMLAGLAYQDASEFSSMRDKMKVLGNTPLTRDQQPPATFRAAERCIAIISDGRGLGTPLSYAIDAGIRQHASIDLLVHGPADAEGVAEQENRIRAAGLGCRCIQLGPVTADNIAGYIRSHASLIFLVAMPDDAAARILMEEVIPRRDSRIPVPLVLIEDRTENWLRAQSVA